MIILIKMIILIVMIIMIIMPIKMSIFSRKMMFSIALFKNF